MIVLTRKMGYERANASLRWPSKVYCDYVDVITEHQYNENIVNGGRWGKERRSYDYTYCGYTPVKISSIEPLCERAKSVQYYEPCQTLSDVKRVLKIWGYSWENLEPYLKQKILKEVQL